jgi:hypothetical protein
VQEKLGQLAASPLPRLAVLEKHFTFEPIPVADMGEKDADKFFAVRMTPTQAELREHIEQVRVLLDATRGLIVRLEMRDSDGTGRWSAFRREDQRAWDERTSSCRSPRRRM